MDLTLNAKQEPDTLILPEIVSKERWQQHVEQIYANLKRLGANSYDMHLPETNALPYIIRAEEDIKGIIYGRYRTMDSNASATRARSAGRGILAVTNHRVVFLDKKPTFMHYDEIPLDLISGVTFTKAGIASRVRLHTRMGDYTVRTFNQRCANIFIHAIEAERLVSHDQKVSIKSHLQW